MMTFTKAITRQPAPTFAQGITTDTSGPPSWDKMQQQHAAYVACLKSIGLDVIELPPLADFPDAYFVEDVAVILPETAVITNPGAAGRNGEAALMAPVLAGHKPLNTIQAPGTMDGGDVMQVDNHFFIGLSARTNEAGARQLGQIVERFGYTWTPVPVGDGLHLKSSVNYVGRQTLLLTAAFAARPEFTAYRQIILNTEETAAGNSLLLNERLIVPAGFPKTYEKLAVLGREMMTLDVSEAAKMDGGLTCMSLRF